VRPRRRRDARPGVRAPGRDGAPLARALRGGGAPIDRGAHLGPLHPADPGRRRGTGSLPPRPDRRLLAPEPRETHRRDRCGTGGCARKSTDTAKPYADEVDTT
jgi:hypothetical protein